MAEPAVRPVAVGWRHERPEGSFAFFPPEPLTPAERACLGPGAEGLGDRILRVRAGYDLRLRISPPGVRPVRVTQVEQPGALSDRALNGMAERLTTDSWRDPERPIMQISLNMLFVTDEPAHLMLTPPFLDPGFRDWPGTLVCGRFPVSAWPRVLNAALEWEDRDREWLIRRGEALAYVWIAFDDPAKVPELVEAADTPAFRTHFRKISGVIAYGRNVGPMFEEAARRRPARLLTAKRLGTPPWDADAVAPIPRDDGDA